MAAVLAAEARENYADLKGNRSLGSALPIVLDIGLVPAIVAARPALRNRVFHTPRGIFERAA